MAKETRVNMRVSVNHATIRYETHNGREHMVIPSFTLPDGVVMNGGMYPHDEIEKSYKSLEGTLAPLSHPQVDGDYVAANQAEAINAHHIGAWNRNVKRVGNRVALEKWVDIEFAKTTEGGRQLIEAVNNGSPIHTSTGIFLNREMTPNADGYGWIARDMTFDHDAILLNEVGAATPEDGVGMMVNKTLVINSVVPTVNDDEALKDSYGDKLSLLSAAVSERFGSPDAYAYVEDFDDEGLVFSTPQGQYRISYHMEDGNPILTGEQKEVKSKTEYIVKNSGWLERLKHMLNYSSKITEQPVQVNTPEEVPDMNPEEVKKALDALKLEMNSAFTESLTSLKDEHAKEISAINTKLTANADAEMADKRAVVAKVHGEVVANGLSGEALDAMHAACHKAAPLIGGLSANSEEDEFKDYNLNSFAETK